MSASRPNPNVSQDTGPSDATEGPIGVIQSAITAAVEAAMRTAVNELVTTLADRISQWLREWDQLSPRMSVAPQTATAGTTQGSNNSTTSGMLCNIGLPVGGIVPSIMQCLYLAHQGGQPAPLGPAQYPQLLVPQVVHCPQVVRWHLSCQLNYHHPRPLWLGEVPPQSHARLQKNMEAGIR